ncbi:NAD-binding protein, partial [Mycobacterium sp. E740]|uniref:NAD-binding protein n=1 Tax=Mycobacterium sp. E740 TaxID=1834149 RepID=UPI0018D4CB50
MRIGIAGAGAVGRSVAQELLDYGHKVLLIEHDARHYEPHTVPAAEWLLADACEISALEESGLQMCDVMIAATGDDKVNLAASLLADHLGTVALAVILIEGGLTTRFS